MLVIATVRQLGLPSCRTPCAACEQVAKVALAALLLGFTLRAELPSEVTLRGLMARD